MAKALTVKILGDVKGLKSATNEADGLIGKLGKGLGTAGGVAAAGLAGMGAAAIALGPTILTTGAKIDALGKKAGTVFEGSLGDVEAWADTVAGSMGLTQSEAVGAAAGLADLLKPMGFTADQAAEMSTDMLDLSGALSAWTGGQQDATQVADVLSKAMLGERDGLKALGISISEADVQARLAANGTDDLTGAALEQAKALATQQLILEKSTDAQKAWADGSMDGIKAQNETKASIAEVKESLITGLYPAFESLLPIAQQAAEWLGENLPGAIAWLQQTGSDLAAKFQEWWPSIRATIEAVVTWLRDEAWPVIQQIWDGIVAGMEVVVAWVREHWPEIRDTISDVIEGVKQVIDIALAAIKFIWENWGDEILVFLENTWALISGVIEGALEIIRGIIKTVTSLIKGDWSGAWDGIKLILEGVWDTISSVVEGALDNIKLMISGTWETVKDWTSEAWDKLKGYVSDGIDGIVDAVLGLPGDVANAAAGAFDAVWDAFKDVANKIIDGWNGLEFSLPRIDTHIPGVGTIGGWTVGTPNIPRFHSGGLTDFGAAGEGLALLRNDEMVIPIDDHAAARSVTASAGVGGPFIGQLVVTDGRNIHDELRLVEALYGQAA